MKAKIILFVILALSAFITPVNAQQKRQTWPKKISFVVIPYDSLRNCILSSGCEVGLMNCSKECTPLLSSLNKEELTWFYQNHVFTTPGDSLAFISLEISYSDDEYSYCSLVNKDNFNGYGHISTKELWGDLQKSKGKKYAFVFKFK